MRELGLEHREALVKPKPIKFNIPYDAKFFKRAFNEYALPMLKFVGKVDDGFLVSTEVGQWIAWIGKKYWEMLSYIGNRILDEVSDYWYYHDDHTFKKLGIFAMISVVPLYLGAWLEKKFLRPGTNVI